MQNNNKNNLKLKDKILLSILPSLAVFILKLWGATIKKVIIGEQEAKEIFKEGAIASFWHNNSFFFLYLAKEKGYNILVSNSKDGEYVAKVLQKTGNFAVRGSSSRGGTSALSEMIQKLKNKKTIGYTPDGPRGPIYTVHDGIIMASLKSQKPIVPVHYIATKEWVFQKSWDKHRAPKPFSTLVLYYGKPFYLPPSKTELPCQEYYIKAREIVKEKMMQNMVDCEVECKKFLK